MPDLSIVTITYNNLDGLTATVDSFLAQRCADPSRYELIVVDNMSLDGSDRYVTGVGDPRITYIREPDAGVYDAMNKGTERAIAPFVMYLNAGDVLHDDGALDHMLEVAQTRDRVATAFGALQVAPGSEPRPHRNVPHRWFLHAFGLRPHCHAAMLFKTQAVRTARGYALDVDFAADFDLIMRLGLIEPIASDTRICVDYDTTGMSATRRREIPMLLHRIRAKRLQYPSWARRLDSTFVLTLEMYRALRRSTRRAVRRGHNPTDREKAGAIA